MNSENNNLIIYLSTYPNSYEIEYNTTHTFNNVKQDYCKDLSKLEKYLDIIYNNNLYSNYNKIYFMGGELGELPKEYVIQLLNLLSSEKYAKYNPFEAANKKIQIFTNGKIFDHISYDDATNIYKISIRQIVNTDYDYKNSYIKRIYDPNNRRKIYNKQSLYYTYILFNTYLNNNTDNILYNKFLNGDFINKNINFTIEHELFSKIPYDLESSKFYGNCITLSDFNSDDCSKYSYNFGIDLVNDTIFKCYRAYDLAPTIELNEDNFKKALQYNIEYFIPAYENSEICKKCKFYLCNKNILSFNFKK